MAMQSYEICPTADGDVIFNGSSLGWISGYPFLYFAFGQTRVVPYVKSERFCFLYIFFFVECFCGCVCECECVRAYMRVYCLCCSSHHMSWYCLCQLTKMLDFVEVDTCFVKTIFNISDYQRLIFLLPLPGQHYLIFCIHNFYIFLIVRLVFRSRPVLSTILWLFSGRLSILLSNSLKYFLKNCLNSYYISVFKESPPDDEDKFLLDVLRQEKVTQLFTSPASLKKLLARNDLLKTPFTWTVRTVIFGGSVFRKEFSRILEKLSVEIRVRYGCTEIGFATYKVYTDKVQVNIRTCVILTNTKSFKTTTTQSISDYNCLSNKVLEMTNPYDGLYI